MVICLERGADLHMDHSWCHCHSLPLASVKSRWFYLSSTGSHGQRVVKWVYICMYVTYYLLNQVEQQFRPNTNRLVFSIQLTPNETQNILYNLIRNTSGSKPASLLQTDCLEIYTTWGNGYKNFFNNNNNNAHHTHPFKGPFSGTTRVSQYQKGKIDLVFLKQKTVSGSGISWATCKSAPRSRQITTPAPHNSVFYRPDVLPAAQPTVSKHWRP